MTRAFPPRSAATAFRAALALTLILSGSAVADEKKKEPAAKPTPSHPARPAGEHRQAAPPPATHSAPANSSAPPARHEQQAPAATANPRYERPSTVTPRTEMPRRDSSARPEYTPRRDNSSQGNFGGDRNRPASAGRPNGGGYSSPAARPLYSPGAGRTVDRGNHQVAMRNNGRASEIYSRDMTIRRGPQGTAMRRTVVERENRVYAFNRAGYGSVRASYSHGGHDYVVRRYYVGGAYFPRYYRPYSYRGVFFDAYAPSVFYSPYYYGWAYRPWSAPIVFSWGWGRSPWYGYYGGYFTPYPSYTSANLWLTDYIVAQTLEASYRERVESARAAQMQYNDQPPQQYAALTPEIKQQIAEEVQRQLAYESAEAQRFQGAQSGGQMQQPMPPPQQQQDPGYTGVGRMIEDGKSHVLLSNANIDVTTLSGQECSISQGDAIAINAGQSSGQGESVQVRVLASAGGGCPANAVVSISLQDLQEMVNHVRATIDSGLAVMQKDPSLPKPPANVSAAPIKADFADAAPPADPNEAAELQRLNQEATATERSVVSDTSYADPTTPAQPGSRVPAQTFDPPARQYPVQQTETNTTELQLGMSPDQVMQMLGKPTNVVKAGPKQIVTYQSLSLKLIFTNDKLTEIQ